MRFQSYSAVYKSLPVFIERWVGIRTCQTAYSQSRGHGEPRQSLLGQKSKVRLVLRTRDLGETKEGGGHQEQWAESSKLPSIWLLFLHREEGFCCKSVIATCLDPCESFVLTSYIDYYLKSQYSSRQRPLSLMWVENKKKKHN